MALIKIIFSFLLLMVSSTAHAGTLNCFLLDKTIDLEYFSAITSGFDLQGYFPAEGWKTPDSVVMSIALGPNFEAKVSLQGGLDGKKISEKKFLKAWWQKDQASILIYYAVYSRASAPQPNFMIQLEGSLQKATLFYKAHGNYSPQTVVFSCRK